MLAVCLEFTKYEEQWHCCLNVLLTELLYSLTFDETRCHFVHIKCSLMPVLRDCFCCWRIHQLLLKTFSLPSSVSLPMRICRYWSLSICKWSLKPRVRLISTAFNYLFLLKIFIFKCNLGVFKHLEILNSWCATTCCCELKGTFKWSHRLFWGYHIAEIFTSFKMLCIRSTL